MLSADERPNRQLSTPFPPLWTGPGWGNGPFICFFCGAAGLLRPAACPLFLFFFFPLPFGAGRSFPFPPSFFFAWRGACVCGGCVWCARAGACGRVWVRASVHAPLLAFFLSYPFPCLTWAMLPVGPVSKNHLTCFVHRVCVFDRVT